MLGQLSFLREGAEVEVSGVPRCLHNIWFSTHLSCDLFTVCLGKKCDGRGGDGKG